MCKMCKMNIYADVVLLLHKLLNWHQQNLETDRLNLETLSEGKGLDLIFWVYKKKNWDSGGVNFWSIKA